MIGALIGLLFSTGLVLVVVAWRESRRPALMVRVGPYVRDLRVHDPAMETFGPRLVAIWRATTTRVGELVGSGPSVSRRLVRAGDPGELEEFRMQQAQWGLAGFGGAFAIALAASARGASLVPMLVLCLAGGLFGVFVCDRRLTARVRDREQRLVREFPVAADLLALAVAAGESPRAAVERVAARLRGPLGDEFVRLLADIRSGTPVPDAFAALGRRTGVPSIARFAEAMAVAVERGTPLVDVLHAQSADVRDAGRRALVESAGRREITMMIPVVFLVLPVTVIFAFYPGWVSLTLTSGL
ncbi:hypothetical protein BHE97_12405 [Aeromicrobium sp. PE09-221]|uniref:type II secretion system F family protein n=1 Tax=Aeromicrobium sp. PE09-221 TaxID=1898043 RepID=UPI000B6FA667|nr:type II secretion system F family protein [Aeromicrobium sp. PE09-221]OUZ08921.1 hypothetical protein BHE97_12405 [Aeromicrobium sp. PE09-221]